MIKVNYEENSGKVIGFDLDKTPYIEITDEERKQPLPDRYSYYWVEDGKFIIKHFQPTEEDIKNDKISALSRELYEIKKWFFDNDWKVNKIVIGEWATNDKRWTDYLSERTLKRARQDEIVAELETYKEAK